MAVTKFSNLTVTSGRTYNTFLAGNPAYVASSYESIATATGTGSSGTITFSSIPSGFKHLQIRYAANDNSGSGATYIYIRLNSDNGLNYTRHFLRGNGSTATAGGTATGTYTEWLDGSTAGGVTNYMGVKITDILDYTNTSKYKTLRGFAGYDANGSGNLWVTSGLWLSTSAVTSITIENGTSFSTTSSFALYGIKEA